MCRLFGMHGGREPVSATFWLLEAPCSLLRQSHRNPDGYGVGTFREDGTPDVDKNAVPAHSDDLFATEAHDERSRTFVAHVRYASVGELSYENTHPFEQHGRLFAHNGVLGDLERVEAELGEEHRALLRGTTDSERLFAVLTKAIAEQAGDVGAGLRAGLTWLAREIPLYSLNFVLTTPTDLWALRYPEKNELLVLERRPGGPRGVRHLEGSSPHGTVRVRADEMLRRPAVMVASEAMTEDPAWTPLEPGELVHVGPDLRVERDLVLPDPPAHELELTGRAADSQAQERETPAATP
jgi:glutamine amidotransferase